MQLYKYATGWLGWDPETALNTSVPLILAALEGKVEVMRLQAGVKDNEHGGIDEADKPSADEVGKKLKNAFRGMGTIRRKKGES